MEFFDQACPPSERLPRHLHAEFTTGMSPFGPVVHLIVNGTPADLLDRLPDLGNLVISADIMHTQRGHARYLHRRGAFFVLPVGGNQPGLFDQLDALAWAEVPIGWMTYNRGHGRQESRTIQIRPAPKGTKSPHVKQVFLVERHVYGLDWEPHSCQAVLGVTSLPAAKVGPRRLAELACGEWSIQTAIIMSAM